MFTVSSRGGLEVEWSLRIQLKVDRTLTLVDRIPLVVTKNVTLDCDMMLGFTQVVRDIEERLFIQHDCEHTIN